MSFMRIYYNYFQKDKIKNIVKNVFFSRKKLPKCFLTSDFPTIKYIFFFIVR